MGIKKKASTRLKRRFERRKRVRKKIVGTEERPRLCVYRSLQYTYAQIISDESGRVLASASTRTNKAEGKSAKSIDSAKALGKKISEIAKEKNIKKVVFDRNGYMFHGRVKAVCESAKEAGLKL